MTSSSDRELETVRKQKQSLDDLLRIGRISQSTYDQVFKKYKRKTIGGVARRIKNLRDITGLLERRLLGVQLRYLDGKIGKKRFERESKTFALGIESVRTETKKLRNQLKEIRKLMKTVSPPAVIRCPDCGTETNPRKTWNMAGRPNKKGERLQLTIGYYKCFECGKTFRRVISKKKIKT